MIIYTLRDFSLLMQKFGKAHFKKTDNWFMVLLLCGEFERAVVFGTDYSLYTYALIGDVISMTGHTAQLLGEIIVIGIKGGQIPPSQL
jgi:hypothetical protein